MLDFDKLIKEFEKASAKVGPLFAVVLGPSGGGKSALCGTTGLNTLFVHFRGEKHGPVSADTVRRSIGLKGTIVPYCADVNEGKDLDANEAYKRLLEILSDDACKKFGTVVLDGLPELEATIVRTHAFINGCMAKDGSHNTFAESRVVVTLFRPIMERLSALHSAGCNVLVTCKIDVKSVDNENHAIEEAAPRLMTYAVAEDLISKFPDILVVGKMTNGKVWKHKIQFQADVTKISKDIKKNIVKFINFSPRISGVLDLPVTLDADLRKVVDRKNGVKKDAPEVSEGPS
jgi:hypothetical protein